jgi:hypothetical protein
VPTSKRPQINDFHYPRIPSRILKDVSHEEVFNCITAKVVTSEIVDDEAVEKW